MNILSLIYLLFIFYSCMKMIIWIHFRFDWISEEVYFVANEQLMYVTGIFLYLNSTINPIIYNLISSKYRKAFKETSCG